MKQLFTVAILIIFFSCTSQQQRNTKIADANQTSIDSISAKTPSEKTDPGTVALVDTSRANPSNLNDLVSTDIDYNERLKQLADKNVFSTIHGKLISTLAENHQEFFKNTPDYDVLSFSKGDLFHNNKDDYAFVVYDRKNSKISIL